MSQYQDLGSLGSVLENQTLDLDVYRKCDITRSIAEAMAYLHAQVGK